MRNDDPFWLPRQRTGWLGSQRPAYTELHDYDFEMRGPYRPGRLLDAYIEWRRFRAAERDAAERGWPLPADELEELIRWREWRRARRTGRRPRWLTERRRDRGRGPEWPRAGL
ncbi:MAG TPA: hypothetical protein VF188_16000 [Longimicrobiales bacterium]